MLALIRMDWTLSRPLLLRTSSLVLLVLWFGNSGPKECVFAGLLLAEFAVGYPLFHDLGPHAVEPYVAALPVSRAQIVGARYLSALLAMGVALLLPLAAAAARGRVLSWPDALLGQGLVGLLLGSLLFLYLPFHFRFGGERGLGAFTAALVGGLVALLARHGWRALMEWGLQAGDRVLEAPALQAGILLAWGALGVASLGVSILAYRKRTSRVQLPAAAPFLLMAAAFAPLAMLVRR